MLLWLELLTLLSSVDDDDDDDDVDDDERVVVGVVVVVFDTVLVVVGSVVIVDDVVTVDVDVTVVGVTPKYSTALVLFGTTLAVPKCNTLASYIATSPHFNVAHFGP